MYYNIERFTTEKIIKNLNKIYDIQQKGYNIYDIYILNDCRGNFLDFFTMIKKKYTIEIDNNSIEFNKNIYYSIQEYINQVFGSGFKII